MSTGFERIGRDPELQDHWIRRLIAFIIDNIIISICALMVVGIISISLLLFSLAAGFPWSALNPFSFPFFMGILGIIYFSFLEAYYGATFGKRIMNLKTKGLDGKKPSINSAFLRNVSKIYWILVLLDTILGLATSGDPHQKLSDRIAGTTVVSAGVSPLRSIKARGTVINLCSHCGKELSSEALYCPHCGKKREETG
ncbi:RDD family protein [Candidatus Bathyarchaeota archaeon]|nr:RDD family protein [Candidatus Bathyarchaeota archaeon]